MVSGNDGGESVHVCFFELGRDYLCNFFRCVGEGILQSFLQSIGKFLYHIRILFHIAGFCTESSIGNVTGVYSKGSHHVPVPFCFQCGGSRLKFNGKIAFSAGKCCGSRAKVNTLINRQIIGRVNVVLS